jgi:hypothetical protein
MLITITITKSGNERTKEPRNQCRKKRKEEEEQKLDIHRKETSRINYAAACPLLLAQHREKYERTHATTETDQTNK